MQTSKSKRRRHKPTRTPQLLIISGVVLLVIMALVFKQYWTITDEPVSSAGELPALQLDRALQAGQPTLAFFHSNNCQQCIVMMETVGEVYPEFANSIALVDVNVYDENNQALLRRVQLQYIPTLIFYNHSGQGQISVGVMAAEQLHQTLADLAGGD